MNKQVYVPRPIKESPLYELKSVDDIKKSELYSVRLILKQKIQRLLFL